MAIATSSKISKDFTNTLILLPFLEHQSTSVNQIYLQLGGGRGVPVGWVVKQFLAAEN